MPNLASLMAAYQIKSAAAQALWIKSATGAGGPSASPAAASSALTLQAIKKYLAAHPNLASGLGASGLTAAALAAYPALHALTGAIGWAPPDSPNDPTAPPRRMSLRDFLGENRYGAIGSILGSGFGAAAKPKGKNLASAIVGLLLGGFTGSALDRWR